MKFRMKNISVLMICIFTLLLCTSITYAQVPPNKHIDTSYLDETDEPVMFKFEPDFLAKNKQRKIAIAKTRKIIDTLPVTDRKRQRLLKDLYKNGVSKRLKKALLVETKFDDVE